MTVTAQREHPPYIVVRRWLVGRNGNNAVAIGTILETHEGGPPGMFAPVEDQLRTYGLAVEDVLECVGTMIDGADWPDLAELFAVHGFAYGRPSRWQRLRSARARRSFRVPDLKGRLRMTTP